MKRQKERTHTERKEKGRREGMRQKKMQCKEQNKISIHRGNKVSLLRFVYGCDNADKTQIKQKNGRETDIEIECSVLT